MECSAVAGNDLPETHKYRRSKRKSDSDDFVAPPLWNTRKKPKMVFTGGKNPVQLLHEKFPIVEFEFAQEGSPHDPQFTATSTLDGETFIGAGASKQRAKCALAVAALRKLGFGELLGVEVQDQLNTEKTLQQSPAATNQQFHMDTDFTIPESQQMLRGKGQLLTPPRAPPSFPNPNSFFSWDQNFATIQNESMQPPSGRNYLARMSQPGNKIFGQLFHQRPVIDMGKARNSPVMLLTELFPNMKIEWMNGFGRGDRQFKVEVEIQGRKFFGEGRSKRLAKLNLAKTVLLSLYGVHEFNDTDTNTTTLSASSPNTLKTKDLQKMIPITQLRHLVGDDFTVEVAEFSNEEDISNEKKYRATVVVQGVTYEAFGKQKSSAKLKATKKAADALRPKKTNNDDNSMHVDSTQNTTVKLEIDADNKPAVIDTSLHPTMVFCEMYRDVHFEYIESREKNSPNEYLAQAVVQGQQFSARAFSKKKAKLRVVLSAFEELHGIAKVEWTSIDVQEALADNVNPNKHTTIHPISLLLKLNQQTYFELTEDANANSVDKFSALVHVGDRVFSGTGANKKTAKTVAARSALTAVFGIDPDKYVEETRNDIFQDASPKDEIPIDFSNSIARAVEQKFAEVFQGESHHKVLAGFVVANDDNQENDEPSLEVVSLGTGTKCITGDHLDNKGQTLNDCHGEIIACRGFRQFLFNELSKALSNDANTIFQHGAKGKYVLRPCYQVYLYINTAPCGDGRVFTLQSPQKEGAKNKTAGLLRTKIENGQGTIPVPENSVQTSDGLLEGERLRTMSCSDKILKWNILGVQGALLSRFIAPIYLSGIVVDLFYNYDALTRALYKRASKIGKGCPRGFKLHKPSLGKPTTADNTRDTSKATSNSFNWFRDEPTIEAVDSTTGMTVVSTASRLCKLNFFNKFMHVLKLQQQNEDTVPGTYHDEKALAKDYQRAKTLLFNSLEKTTCGKWIGKPYEHDRFGY